MADDTADRLTFLAVAPFGDLNVFAAVGEHETSRRTLTFWIWLGELEDSVKLA